MKPVLVLTSLLLFLSFVVASAAPATGKVLLRGKDTPAAQAVHDLRSGATTRRAVTTDDGSFYLADLPAGAYTVIITYRGAKSELRCAVPGALVFYVNP